MQEFATHRRYNWSGVDLSYELFGLASTVTIMLCALEVIAMGMV